MDTRGPREPPADENPGHRAKGAWALARRPLHGGVRWAPCECRAGPGPHPLPVLDGCQWHMPARWTLPLPTKIGRSPPPVCCTGPCRSGQWGNCCARSPWSGSGRGGDGKWVYSGRAVHSRDQASWSLNSFLVAFVLPISGADVIACWTELWWLGNPVSGSHRTFPS